MTHASNKEILDKGVLITLDNHTYTGSRRLDGSRVNTTELPRALVTPGAVRVYPKAPLRVFNATKRAMERAVADVGISMHKGHFVAFELVDDLVGELEEQCRKFDDARDELFRAGNFERHRDVWFADHPDYRAVKSLGHSESYVRGQLGCGYHLTELRPVTDVGGAHCNSQRQVLGLADRLYEEIANEALDVYEKSFDGKDSVLVRALPRIERLAAKMRSLRFVDASIMPLSRRIQSFLDAAPKTGSLEGGLLVDLATLLTTLGQPEKARALGVALRQASQDQAVEPAPAAAVGDDLPTAPRNSPARGFTTGKLF